MKKYNDHHKRISGVSRINTQYGTPIHLRKWDINDRVRIGDLEVDTVWGKAGTKQCLLTCVDRKSRKLFIRRILHKNAIDVQILLKDLLMNDIGLKIVKSVTQDRGTEFSLIWTLSSQLNIKVYVCHPYASCEKGSNENINGILRRFIPKGTDISTISDDQLKIIINEINNMPRKIHGFRSANQIWEEELAKKSN
jgi:IS30 family transposase